MTIPRPIDWTADGAVRILDQTLLPDTERYLDLDTVDAVAEAIRTLRVRGAPLIGIAAAMGVTLALRGPPATTWPRRSVPRRTRSGVRTAPCARGSARQGRPSSAAMPSCSRTATPE